MYYSEQFGIAKRILSSNSDGLQKLNLKYLYKKIREKNAHVARRKKDASETFYV